MRINTKGLHWSVAKLAERDDENVLLRVARRPADQGRAGIS